MENIILVKLHLNYKNNRVNGFIKNNHIYMFENDYNRRCKHEDDRIIGSFRNRNK